MITGKETLRIMYQEGRRQALDLQERSGTMTGTEIIAEEQKIPAFDSQKDYSQWPIGAPVTDEGQVWTLIQPHNAVHYGGRPSTLRALWGLAHTTDPAKAKPFVAPYGISGLYMTGECCTENGSTHRSKVDNNPYAPSEYPANWEEVTVWL